WLQEIVASIKIAKTGYGFLISQNGTFVTHPKEELVMNETIFSQAEARGDDELRRIGRKMIRGESGFVPFRSILTGKLCWMVYAPLSSSKWSLAVLFPQDELMADVVRLNKIVITLGLLGFLFLLFVIVFIARSITRPLSVLAGAAEDIATGNLDAVIPEIGTGDEVGKLAQSFDYMKTSLKQYIADLTEATAAKERIESELQIAHDIQMGILPKIFPAFPDMPEFDLYATLEPAREVGGDLFDFFFLDDEHLCFNVGDVSGKGVPAALFMAITRTLIKTKATKNLTPEVVLHRVNQDLSMDNPSLLFVTLFLGILNIKDGTVEYCNGGHNPPYIIRASGEIEAVEMTGGIALGVMEGFSFQSKQFFLNKGDALFIYSDGVTEAMNSKLELFSEARLEGELDRLKGLPVGDILAGVMGKILEFSQDEPQTDDITMMIIRYNGSDGVSTVVDGAQT
ncbi:MAG: SpoIIE family protein phosphatase, partial [Deltaproteobacteria bacterium]|nr:SpoIIE family protein phosphatase [Deltaproteobacteria bacterium]